MSKVCPYGDLFIYHLAGALDAASEADLGPDFIGNWVEEDTSFLFFSRPADERVERTGIKVLARYRLAYEDWQGTNLE
ncbi:MAG: hypothetical protein JRI97_13100, partial [Deltaproteobacteria bacterium]|nr:hypothetical protein [Deltaproteobacteria bacterium]